MARTITVTFGDKTQHVYQDVPDDVNPQDVIKRAQTEFSKPVINVDGGRAAKAAPAAPAAEDTGFHPFRDIAEGFTEPFRQVGRNYADSAARANATATEPFNPSRAIRDLPGGIARDVRNVSSVLTSVPSALMGAVTNPIAGAVTAAGFRGVSGPSVSTQGGLHVDAGRPLNRQETQAALNAELQTAASGARVPGKPPVGIIGPRAPAPPAAAPARVLNAGEKQAAKLIRDALGPDVDKALVILKNTPEGVLPTQALADAGIDADTYMALAKAVAKSPKGAQTFRRIAEGQEAERVNTMNRVASGATDTNAMQAIDASGHNLNALSGPMREKSLARANRGNTEIPPLEAEAAAARDLATIKTAQARALGPLAQRTANDVNALDAVGPEIYNYEAVTPTTERLVASPSGVTQEVINRAKVTAGRAEEGLSNAAQSSLAAGEAARTAESKLADLKAADIEKLDLDKLTAQMRARVSKSGTETAARDAVEAAIQELKTRAKSTGGIVDANDVYEVRKNSLNDEIRNRLKNEKPKVLDKRVADILSSLRPMFDSALEDAGGKGWTDYLNVHASGARNIERQKLGAEAGRLYRTSKPTFERLVGGNAPKIVRKTMGGGTYDIEQALAPDNLPSRLPAMQEVAGQLARDRRIDELATSGQSGAQELLKREGGLAPAVLRKFLFLGSPKLAAVETFASTLNDMRVAPKIQAALVEGFRSGKSASELLAFVPLRDRLRLAPTLTNPLFWTTAGVVSQVQPKNAMAPSAPSSVNAMGQ